MLDSKFIRLGLRVVRRGNAVHLLLPVKEQDFRKLLHLCWLGVWIGSEAALLAFLVFSERSPIPLPPSTVRWSFLILFTLSGPFMLYRWLWYFSGRELFVFTDEGMVVHRGLWRMGLSRAFNRRNHFSIRGRALSYRLAYPSWGRMFIGHENGEIAVEEGGKTYCFGRGLDERDAREVACLIGRMTRFALHSPPGLNSELNGSQGGSQNAAKVRPGVRPR